MEKVAGLEPMKYLLATILFFSLSLLARSQQPKFPNFLPDSVATKLYLQVKPFGTEMPLVVRQSKPLLSVNIPCYAGDLSAVTPIRIFKPDISSVTAIPNALMR